MKYHFILTLVSLKTTFIISLQTAKMGCEAPTETKSTIDPGNNGMTNTIISASASEIEKGVILQKGRLLIPTKLIWDYLFSTAPDIVEKAATDPNPLLDIIAQRIHEHCEASGEYFIHLRFQADFGSQKQEKYLQRSCDIISLLLRRRSKGKFAGIAYFESINDCEMELGIDHEDDIMQIDELAFGGRQKEEITYKEIVGKFLQYMLIYVEKSQNFVEIRFDPQICSVADAKKIIQEFSKVSKIIEDKLGRKIAAVRKLNGITKFSFCILWFDLGRVDLALNHRIKYSENDEIDRMSVSFDHKIVKESIDMCFFSDLLFDNKQKQLMYFLVDQYSKGERDISITPGFEMRQSYLGTFNQIIGLQFKDFENVILVPEMIDEGYVLDIHLETSQASDFPRRIDAIYNYLINQMPHHQKIVVAGIYNRGDTLQKLLDFEKQRKEGKIAEFKLDFQVKPVESSPQLASEAPKQDLQKQPEIIENEQIEQDVDDETVMIVDSVLQSYLYSMDNPIEIDCSKFNSQYIIMNMGKIRKQIEQSLLGEDKINMGTTSVGGVYIQIERAERVKIKKSRLGSRCGVGRVPVGGKKVKALAPGQKIPDAQVEQVNSMFNMLIINE